jgi:acyl carrier protein
MFVRPVSLPLLRWELSPRKLELVETAQIYPKLTQILQSVFGDRTLTANPYLTARDVPGWDSLRNIRLMLTIEKSFKVRFSASEIGKLKNVGDLAQLIQSKV